MIIDTKKIKEQFDLADENDQRKIIAELEILLVNLKTQSLKQE